MQCEAYIKISFKMAIPLFSTLLDNYYIFLPDLSCHFYKINNCTVNKYTGNFNAVARGPMGN